MLLALDSVPLSPCCWGFRRTEELGPWLSVGEGERCSLLLFTNFKVETDEFGGGHVGHNTES